MALLPYVEDLNANDDLRRVMERMAIKLNVLKLVANSEAAFMPFNRLGDALMRKAKLSGKLREVAILRTAKLTGSVYEWTQHVPIALRCGVSQEQVEAMGAWQGATCFDQLERLVLQLTDECTTGVKGDPKTVEALKRHLGPDELVELLLSIGWWGMVARLLETLEVELEPNAGSQVPFN